jgi:hypothetical protein
MILILELISVISELFLALITHLADYLINNLIKISITNQIFDRPSNNNEFTKNLYEL